MYPHISKNKTDQIQDQMQDAIMPDIIIKRLFKAILGNLNCHCKFK